MKLIGFTSRILGAALLLLWLQLTSSLAADTQIGAAKIDVTPDYPIWLSGYAARYSMATNTGLKLWTKALAIGSDAEGPALFMTVDNCGVSKEITDTVADRLLKKTNIPRERLVLCSTHTHTAPCLSGVIPNLFSRDFTAEEQRIIDQYTRTLIDKLEQVALSALARRQPGTLSWAQGTADFARNRRTPNGPVDHALPVIKAVDATGNLIGLIAAYACHCTTLGSEYNQFHGDWAGEAGALIEKQHPGAIALISIGCGADANPFPRGSADNARQHGAEVSASIDKLLSQKFSPLLQKPECKFTRIELPFSSLPTREEWLERSKEKGIVGFHAQKNLARLDRGETLPTNLPYAVQTWVFGNDLAMVFLAGEVVVDYSLRLKREFDPARLWVNGYANEVPCYIPSRRILTEGGYEAETSLWYYDRPARLAPETEDLVIRTVHAQMPAGFKIDPKQSQFPPPQSPAESLASIQVKPQWRVELVAAEPLIESPVAIDFGVDGRLWVVEMRDYPSGMDGKGEAGGRVKVLKSSKADGHYDSATTFVEGFPFPTGLMAWGKGVLICAAPDILYAADTDGDGKADSIKKLFSGFATHNFQARVNCLRWGLDGWVYGAAGLFGGKIKSTLTGKEIDLTGRDFRFRPDTGEIEAVNGLSQQGRVRDDFGNWFGCDNSTLAWHFPLPDYYLRRNPHISSPAARVFPFKDGDPNQLYPVSRTLERFNSPESANHTTSACGLELFRAPMFGPAQNAFVCEPVHNLVRRMLLSNEGTSFAATRPAEEARSEFLASTDNWFRPVEARTGPDGALWIVDMYRFVIEHPRWISADRLSQLDVRAGATMGRIYRVVPNEQVDRPILDLTQASAKALVSSLESSAGPLRDLAHREILSRNDPSIPPLLQNLARAHANTAVRVQALWVLQNLGKLDESLLLALLKDTAPAVRKQAVQASESLLNQHPALGAELLRLASDKDAAVAFQVALSLGEWDSPRTGPALAELTRNYIQDPWMRTAVLSSALRHPEEVVRTVVNLPPKTPGRDQMFGQLLSMASASGNPKTLDSFIAETGATKLSLSQVATLMEALQRTGIAWAAWSDANPKYHPMLLQIREKLAQARRLCLDPKTPVASRKDAVRLLGWDQMEASKDLEILRSFLDSGSNAGLQEAALESFRHSRLAGTADFLLGNWSRYSPNTRSAVLLLLLSREEWASHLLAAIEKQTVLPRELPVEIRQRLLNSSQLQLKQKAGMLLGKNSSEGRAQVLARYQPAASLQGDVIHGGQLFEQICSTCHSLRGRGFPVGPNLAEYASKKPEDFLLAILDPNAAIEPKFVSYELELNDGRSLTGLIKNETASSFQLVQAGGVAETLLRTQVKSVNASRLSLMPEGLEEALPPQSMADLIAYLKQGGPGLFGGASPEQAARARAQFRKQQSIGFEKLLKAAEQSDYASWLGRLPMAVCRQTDGKSTLAWTAPPASSNRTDTLTYVIPIALGFHSHPSGVFHLLFNNRSALDFDVTLGDQTWQSKDGKLKLTYTVMEANAEDSNGVLQVEAAPDLADPGKPVKFEVTGSPSKSQRWFGLYLVKAGSL